MNDKTFIDTDVLMYAHDVAAGSKQQIAAMVLRQLWSEGSGALSVQVLQEFYVNVARKIPVPPSKPAARQLVSNYAIWCTETTSAEISAAFRIEDESRIGFWDALIVSSASKSGATQILSEDFNAGQTIAAVLIENPFVDMQ